MYILSPESIVISGEYSNIEPVEFNTISDDQIGLPSKSNLFKNTLLIPLCIPIQDIIKLSSLSNANDMECSSVLDDVIFKSEGHNLLPK